jgi:hypothetical protein
MKQNFKVGDKVKCISRKKFPQDGGNWAVLAKLKIGESYTVCDVSGIGEKLLYLQLKENGFYIDSRNFELYTEPKALTISILPVTRKGETFYRYQFKSKNGEILNDKYPTKGNASRGLKKFIKDIQENNFTIEK